MGVLRPRKRPAKSAGVDGERFLAGAEVRAIDARGTDGQASEAAGVDEAEFARVCEREDGVGVGRQGHVGVRDEQAAGHAEVDEELGRGRVGSAVDGALERGNDGLADAPDFGDRASGEDFDDLGFGALEGLWFAAGPHGNDALPADALVDAVGDGFDFGEFRHGERTRLSRCVGL